jgi:hypothetical protein
MVWGFVEEMGFGASALKARTGIDRRVVGLLVWIKK